MFWTSKPLSTGHPSVDMQHANELNPLKWMLPCIWLCGKSVYGGTGGMHWRGMVAEVLGGREV